MKFVDSSVISEPVEFIFNLLNVVVTKKFLFSLMKLSNLFKTPCIYIYICILTHHGHTDTFYKNQFNQTHCGNNHTSFHMQQYTVKSS